MDREKIKVAAQLSDDLRKVNRAIGVLDNCENVSIRVSATNGSNNEEPIFAYLPKRFSPIISKVLKEAQNSILRDMDEL